MENEQRKLLTVGDAARFLGVSESTVRRWDKEGKVKSVRTLGGHRRFLETDLRVLYNKQEQNGITF